MILEESVDVESLPGGAAEDRDVWGCRGVGDLLSGDFLTLGHTSNCNFSLLEGSTDVMWLSNCCTSRAIEETCCKTCCKSCKSTFIALEFVSLGCLFDWSAIRSCINALVAGETHDRSAKSCGTKGGSIWRSSEGV